MEKKQKVDFIESILLTCLSMTLLLLPIFKVTSVKWIFFGLMIGYAVLNFIQFIITRRSKDYEGLLTTLTSIAVGISSLAFNLYESPLKLAISLLIWIAIMSLVKVKKVDYYHDRDNKVWRVKILLLSIFIVVGLFTCINLMFGREVQILVIGYFFLIHGILELIDPLLNYYLGDK